MVHREVGATLGRLRRGRSKIWPRERRYYALLFSHEFASNFWKSGNLITFQVPQQSFNRRMADGSIGIVNRKAYTRRTAREGCLAIPSCSSSPLPKNLYATCAAI